LPCFGELPSRSAHCLPFGDFPKLLLFCLPAWVLSLFPFFHKFRYFQEIDGYFEISFILHLTIVALDVLIDDLPSVAISAPEIRGDFFMPKLTLLKYLCLMGHRRDLAVDYPDTFFAKLSTQ
jgi:hypothetical protein